MKKEEEQQDFLTKHYEEDIKKISQQINNIETIGRDISNTIRGIMWLMLCITFCMVVTLVTSMFL